MKSLATVPLILLLVTGCATWKAPSMKMPWSNAESEAESKFEPPARIAVVWTDSVLTSPGKPPTRGFGGRIYFFNAKSQAIPVEGQLVVYAYDDSESKPGNRPADRRFVFTPEQFTQHFSETEIGASYSVWIPWDTVGGEEREINLLPVFTSKSGHRVAGAQSLNVLPGRNSNRTGAQQVELHHRQHDGVPSDVHQVAYQRTYDGRSVAPQTALKAGEVTSNQRTTTINVPRTLSKAMSQSPTTPAVGWIPPNVDNPYANRMASLPNASNAGMAGATTVQMGPASGSRLYPSQRITRFERTGFQAPRSPIGRLGYDPAQSQPTQ